MNNATPIRVSDTLEIIEALGGNRILRYHDEGEPGSCKAIQVDDKLITLGQKVFANGTWAISKGSLGLVVKITEPYTDGRTLDVFDVWFEDQDFFSMMKLRELEPITTTGKLESLVD